MFIIESDENKNIVGKHITPLKNIDDWRKNSLIVVEFDEETFNQIDNLTAFIWDNTIKELIKKITTTVNKSQVVADGIDTATILATIDDVTSSEVIELYHYDVLVDSVNAVNGIAAFEVTMTQTGTLELTVKSTTKYGKTNVMIEGV